MMTIRLADGQGTAYDDERYASAILAASITLSLSRPAVCWTDERDHPDRFDLDEKFVSIGLCPS